MKKLILIMAALVLCTHIAEAGQNSAATIHIDVDTAAGGIQTSRNVPVGEIFDVDIVINGASNLAAFNLVVTFPQDILLVSVSATEGAFLKSLGAATFFIPTLEPGSVELTCATLGVIPDAQAPDGDGVLARLTFKVSLEQEANIVFSTSATQALTDNNYITDDPVALDNAYLATVNGDVNVDPDQSTVDATSPVTADGTSTSTITITAIDTNGNPMPGIPPENIVVTSNGTGNEINPPTTATDAEGKTTATMSSTVAETKNISVTINGTAITDTASVAFTAVPDYTIDASAGPGGVITPSGAVTVNSGENRYFIIKADPGYSVADVLVDGESVGAVASYGFTNVTADHTIAASFDINTYDITASAGPGGTITPSGEVPVNSGANQSFTIAADNGYRILDVLVDGVSVGAVASYPFTDVTADHTIAASFTEDVTPPAISGHIPEPDSIQVARDTIIQLHITDEMIGITSGVDLESVQIQVAGVGIYKGDVATYDSDLGTCRRVEITEDSDYLFVFQPSTLFDYEQKVYVVVYAKDKAGNEIKDKYHFHTVMRSFGPNIQVNSDTGTLVQNRPDTAMDSEGNIWVVWDQTSDVGDTDIYIGKLSAEGSAFEESMPVFSGANNQSNPAIAIDGNDKLYVVWEEFADPNWNILLLTSDNGNIWKYELSSDPCQVNADNPDDKALNITQNPAIAISGDEMYITWDEKRAGNKDIWVRKSDIGQAKFDWKVATPVTEHASSQSEPAIAIDEIGTAYIVWTDERNAGTTGTDIYGADSVTGNWENEEIVKTSFNQWSPAIAAESSGTVLHLLWVDDTDPNESIFYRATTDGLQGPLEVDLNVVDEPNYVQSAPAIAVSGAGETAKVFACWQDGRWIDSGDVADIYFAESGSGFDDRNNVLVNDDGVYENTQTAPDIGDIGVDKYGNPYIVWVDDRNGNKDIYYAGATSIQDLTKEPVPVPDDPNAATVPTTQANLQVTIPNLDDENAHVDPSTISIGEVRNLSVAPPPGGFGLMYDFGPSGLEFDTPATIRIPLDPNAPSYSQYIVYRWRWYQTPMPMISSDGEWTTDGIHNPATKSSDGTYLEVQVDHFSVFLPGGGTSSADGGGCEISPTSQGNVIEYMLPYVLLTVVWVIIKRKDARNRKTA